MQLLHHVLDIIDLLAINKIDKVALLMSRAPSLTESTGISGEDGIGSDRLHAAEVRDFVFHFI